MESLKKQTKAESEDRELPEMINSNPHSITSISDVNTYLIIGSQNW